MRVQSGTTRQIAEDLELAQLLRKQDPADAGGGWKGAPKCQDCNQPLGVGPWRHVMGKDYHRDCFKCKGCGWAIRERVFDLSQGEAFHRSCLPPSNVPTCKVCHEQLPVEQGVYHFHRHAMFDEKYCPWHQDSVRRCCSCLRLEPMPAPTRNNPGTGRTRERERQRQREYKGGQGGSRFCEMQDGRVVCMACATTAVVDSSEAGPAFADVCDFLETDLGLIVPPDMRVVPVLVVDSPTLNEHSSRDTNTNTNTLETHTRGLTLSEVATFTHYASGAMQYSPNTKGSFSSRFRMGPRQKVCLGQSRAVTAILVLCGLPYSSFTSILAHEAMHAWMKLTHSFPWGLPAQVEEGVCQLVAYLWLVHLAGKLPEDEQAQEGGEPSANQLREFFVHQIETDISPVYGDGYRMAKRAYDEVGLEALLSHIAEHKSFPLL
ncbi:unnamed protein product [Discosporangium mesarthrocarpum]